MPKDSFRISRTQAGLLVVDMQERLLPAMSQPEALRRNCVRLIQGVAILRVPILATEQYPKGLGPTVAEVAGAIPGFAPIEKLSFSACGAGEVFAKLTAAGISDVVLCGMETHVCVLQTCLDLLQAGVRVFVVADATGSRTVANHELGLGRMREAGAVVVSVEMILFELLGQAGTEEFKQVLALVK